MRRASACGLQRPFGRCECPSPAGPARSPGGLTMLHAGPSADRADWPSAPCSTSTGISPSGPGGLKESAGACPPPSRNWPTGSAEGVFQQCNRQTACGMAPLSEEEQADDGEEGKGKLERTAASWSSRRCNGPDGASRHARGVKQRNASLLYTLPMPARGSLARSSVSRPREGRRHRSGAAPARRFRSAHRARNPTGRGAILPAGPRQTSHSANIPAPDGANGRIGVPPSRRFILRQRTALPGPAIAGGGPA